MVEYQKVIGIYYLLLENGFEISGRVKYTKYTEEEIINVLNVIGLCIK